MQSSFRMTPQPSRGVAFNDLLLLLLFQATSGIHRSEASFVHPSCRYCQVDCTQPRLLLCYRGGPDDVVFLNDFNLSAVPADMHELRIADFSFTTTASFPVNEAFPSVPARSDLVRVDLRGNERMLAFSDVFPFSRFLAYNRYHLKFMTLTSVKLLRLTREDFSGFSQLESLMVETCLVTEIAADVFDELVAVPPGK